MRSPFYIVPEFLSPKQCEEFISNYEVKSPNLNLDGKPTKLERLIPPEGGQDIILQKLRSHIPLIEERYYASYRLTEQFSITHYPENDKEPAEKPGCESSQYLKRRWIKTKDIDLTGIIWLKDYRDEIPLDPRMEVYGGKTEFPAYNFSLVPQRGTLVLYPATPHFITCVSPILVSDLYQIKVNIALSGENNSTYLYDPTKFPCGPKGFIEGWLNEWI
jgi:hypothetical protein